MALADSIDIRAFDHRAEKAEAQRRARRSAAARREFRLYYAATYPVFLLVALLARVLPRRLRPFSEPGLSVFGEARAAAHTVLPFVFRA